MATKYQRNKEQRERDILRKKYHCHECDRSFRDSSNLARHLGGMKHNPQRYVHYQCDVCNYQTKFKSVYDKHLTSKKHIRATQ